MRYFKRALKVKSLFFLLVLLFMFSYFTDKVQACCHIEPIIGCVGANCEWDCGCDGDLDCGWDCFWECCGGCFTGETGIQLKTEDSKLETKEIKDLKPGDVVESFDPETGEVKEGTVSDVTKTTREGYYILETEGGEKVKVTGEHPFLAIKGENNQAPNSPAGRDPATRDKSQTISKFQNSISKLGEIFSHTLTYRLMTSFQNKLNQIFN